MVAEKSTAIDVTVAVCTRNRARQLSSFLDSLVLMRKPSGLVWELLLVDNGSTDDTRAVVESYLDRLPVRYAREEKAGLSNARNLAVAEARGKYICWTDDDVQLDGDWLCAYAEAFRQHPNAVLFGGRILPRLEEPTPPWFARLAELWPVSDIIARRDFGDDPLPLTFEGARIPWGANFAVRTAEQRPIQYDQGLGVSPNQRRLGEEAEVIFELMRDGAEGWWVPNAKVHHIIPTRRQSRKYFFEYYASVGETLAYLEATRTTHHMNRTGQKQTLVSGSTLALGLAGAVQLAVFVGFMTIGLTRRSLYHLRRSAIYFGARSFKNSEPQSA